MSNTQQKTTKKKKATAPAPTQAADDTATAAGTTIWQHLGANPRLRPVLEFLLVQLPGQLKVAWDWVKENKTKLVWTIVLVATVLGTGLLLYVWRRELETLAGFVWDKIWGWLSRRWDQQPLVVVAKSAAPVVKEAATKATTGKAKTAVAGK